MTRTPLADLKGDLAGGIVSSLVAIPLAIGFGMFAFVGLGDAYFGQGMVAGLSTAVIVALVCVGFGERGTAVYAPRVITTFFIGAIIVNSLLASHPEFMHSGDSQLVLAVVFAVVLAAGAFQVLFGLTRVAQAAWDGVSGAVQSTALATMREARNAFSFRGKGGSIPPPPGG